MKTTTAIPQQLNIFETRGKPVVAIQIITRGAYFLIEAGLIKKEVSMLFVFDTSTKEDVPDFKRFDACLFDPNTSKWSSVKKCEVKQEFGKLLFSELTWSVFTCTDQQIHFMKGRKPQQYWDYAFETAKNLLDSIESDTHQKIREQTAAQIAALVVEMHMHDKNSGEKLADEANYSQAAIDAVMDHWKTMQNKEEAKIIQRFVGALGRAMGEAEAENAQWLADYKEGMG